MLHNLLLCFLDFISCWLHMPRNCMDYIQKGAIKPILRGEKGKKPFQDHLMYRVVLR
jgi:hypothetical protein